MARWPGAASASASGRELGLGLHLSTATGSQLWPNGIEMTSRWEGYGYMGWAGLSRTLGEKGDTEKGQ